MKTNVYVDPRPSSKVAVSCNLLKRSTSELQASGPCDWSSFSQVRPFTLPAYAAGGVPFGIDFARISIFPPGPPVVQGKLEVAPTVNPLEQEADLFAERIMRMPVPSAPPAMIVTATTASMPLLRNYSRRQAGLEADESKIQRKRLSDDDMIHGKLIGSPPQPTVDLEQKIHALGGGQPLLMSERDFFEPRLGHDFRNVRVHTDAQANAVAHAVQARAFTYGRNIVFAAGQFSPGTRSGRLLLGHELTHVVQQEHRSSNTIQRDLATPPPVKMPAAQPDLTPDQIKAAIRFNQSRYDAVSTRQIQGLIGTKPTGTWIEDDILAIASLQEEYGLHKDGMVGPNTFRFLDNEVRLEKLKKTDANCLLAFQIIGPDPSTISPIVGGQRTIKGHFKMAAQFSKYCGCADYEYRQFIRGHWKRERGGVTTDLGSTFTTIPGGAGLTTAFQEDGNTTIPALNYGHRTQPDEPENHYLDDTGAVDQAAGCRYEGEDRPGGPDSVTSGDVFDIDVNFRGEIQRKGNVVSTKHWTAIKGRFPVP